MKAIHLRHEYDDGQHSSTPTLNASQRGDGF